MADITLAIAFLAGIVSFFSPCILPIIPGFLAYLGGITKKTSEIHGVERMTVFWNALAFVIGFAIIFALVGYLLTGLLGGASYTVKAWLQRIGGTIIILFGLYLLHVIRIPFLEREHKVAVKNTKYHLLTSFLFGASFAIGWSPCVGAVLGSILTLAASMPESAFPLLISYALGLGVPFLITGLFIGQAQGWLGKSQKFLQYFEIIAGILLIILGILVFTGYLSRIANVLAFNIIPI